MSEPTLPEDRGECDSCRFETRELTLTQKPLDPQQYWCCEVCRWTMVSSTILYPNQWSHESAEVMRTVAWGINAILMRLEKDPALRGPRDG